MPKCQMCLKNEVSFKELFNGKEMCSECEQNGLKVPIIKKIRGFLVILFLSFCIYQCAFNTKNDTSQVERVELSNGQVQFNVGSGTKSEVNEHSTPKSSKLSYKIIHEHHSIRVDGGISYFVFVSGVDLSNDAFKARIKSTVDDITAKKGKKISIEFFNNQDVLELYYNSPYVTGKIPNSPDEDLSKKEHAKINSSLVASFDGQLSTGLYLNTLYFFPSAFDETPKIGKYVEEIEYDPQ